MIQYQTGQIRNEQGVWINSQVFREEGLHFFKNKYYCPDPEGTHSYTEYWDEMLKRCMEGYSVGGVKITQHHFFYLNFCQIDVAEKVSGVIAVKDMRPPSFWDGDYNYFWAIEIAKNGLFNTTSLAPATAEERIEYWKLEEEREKIVQAVKRSRIDANIIVPLVDDKAEIDGFLKENSDKRLVLEERILRRLALQFKIEVDWRDGGHHIIIGKARRKGYSFKNGSICANIYNTIRGSQTIIGAFDKKYLYPAGTMGMASEYLSFLNEHTAWAKGREYVDKQEHKKASFKEINELGVVVEAGYKSEIMAITFKDNPEAARGKDPKYVLFEEAGQFPNLKESFRKTSPGLEAGKYITGQIIIFGTGGDMEHGTVDYADMFYNPKQDNLMPFINIWDDDAEGSCCGFFHPVTWNMEGYFDEQGNSDIIGAAAEESETRAQIIRNSTDSGAIQQHAQEFPFCPAEAFLISSMNDFPVMELRAQYNKVVREKLHLIHGQACYIERESINEPDSFTEDGVLIPGRKSRIKVTPDLEGLLNPLWTYKPKTSDIKGAVVIWEHPVSRPPRGLYKMSFDPYRQDQSTLTLPSLAAIYVYKGLQKFSYTANTIAAQFIGRPYDPDDVNRIAEMLAELYNAEIMHENEVTHVKKYFERKKKLHLLAAQPDGVISKNIKASKVARVWGCHMNDKLKDAGEKYIKQWLLEERDYDENGNMVLQLETIKDPALLEELIFYNRKGNFDRVSSLMMLMFQIAEEEEGKEYGDKNDFSATNEADLLRLMKLQYNNTNDLQQQFS